MVGLSEKETREKYIDSILKDELGWKEALELLGGDRPNECCEWCEGRSEG